MFRMKTYLQTAKCSPNFVNDILLDLVLTKEVQPEFRLRNSYVNYSGRRATKKQWLTVLTNKETKQKKNDEKLRFLRHDFVASYQHRN